MGGSNSYLVFILLISMFIVTGVYAAGEEKTLSGLNLEDFSESTSGEVDWSKNPFLKPAHDVSVDELKLTGIVYAEGDSAALINGQVVRKSDKIGTSEIVEIGPERVILRNENGIFSLSLRGGGQ